MEKDVLALDVRRLREALAAKLEAVFSLGHARLALRSGLQERRMEAQVCGAYQSQSRSEPLTHLAAHGGPGVCGKSKSMPETQSQPATTDCTALATATSSAEISRKG